MPMKYYAAICLIAKDESKDIQEWLLYHFAIGFEHVVIYDNNSREPLRDLLKDFIDAGLVTVFDWPLTQAQQLSAYMHALNEWGRNATWLAFIDVDEFILPLEKNDIRDFLDGYIQFGGVGANWCMFGSNGHLGRPKGRILENYTSCIGLDGHIKSIVRPDAVEIPISAHHFKFKNGFYCVNEDGIPIVNFHTYPLANKIRINHYYYKSQQDFYEKMERGLVTQMREGVERKISDFYEHLKLNEHYDGKILKFMPFLNKLYTFPAPVIAKVVQRDANYPLLDGVNEIDKCIEHGEMERAQKIYNTLIRYHHDFDLMLLGAHLHFLQGQYSAGLSMITDEMVKNDISNDELRKCFQAIANYYGACGRAEARKSVMGYIS